MIAADYLDLLANKYGTDKRHGIHSYTLYYHQLMQSARMDVKRMLEIGIYTGASIRMWKDYFPNAEIWCMDQMQVYVDAFKDDNRVRAICTDATTASAWIGIPDGLDYIIDDGSHNPEDQLASFNAGFWHLKKGGYYIVEDMHVAVREDKTDIFCWFFDRVMDNQVFGYTHGDFYEAIAAHDKDITPLTKAIKSISFRKSLIIVEKA